MITAENVTIINPEESGGSDDLQIGVQLGELKTQVASINAAITTLTERLDLLETRENWTRDDISNLYRDLANVAEQAADAQATAEAATNTESNSETSATEDQPKSTENQDDESASSTTEDESQFDDSSLDSKKKKKKKADPTPSGEKKKSAGWGFW